MSQVELQLLRFEEPFLSAVDNRMVSSGQGINLEGLERLNHMSSQCEFLFAGRCVPDLCLQVGFAPRNKPISPLLSRAFNSVLPIPTSTPDPFQPLPSKSGSSECCEDQW
jgi:hypothetical protein